MTDLTIQQSSRHAVYVQRFAGYLANLFDPSLTKLQRELKILMADAPTETTSIRHKLGLAYCQSRWCFQIAQV